MNEVGIKRLGYTQDKLSKMTVVDLIAPDKRSEMRKNAIELQNNGHVTFETVNITKDGTKIPVEISNHLFEIKGKKVTHAIVHDISDRKKAEKALKKSEMKYKKIFDTVQDVFFQTDTNGNIIEISPSIERYSGYKPEELIGKPVEIVYSNPDDRNSFLKEFGEKGEIFDYELKLKTKKEDLIYSSINAKLLLDSKNKPIGIEGTLRDVTERKKAGKKIRESEKKYREVVETAGESIILIDKIGNITEVNQKTSVLTGFERKELVGKSLMTLAPKMKMNLEVLSVFKDIITGKDVDEMEWDLVNRKSGEKKTVLAHYSPLRDEEKIKGIVVVLEDITELKNRENTLNKSLEEKEMLLKEIHHRVKNNLMIISSLLNLQSSYIKDKASQDIFKESQNRARSMALIHERLYQSTDLKRIDFGDYITSLANELFHTYVADSSLIELKINVEDIFLDINTAIP